MVDACRTQLDLETVGRIIFEFCFLLECNVRTGPLLEIDICRQLELAFAFGTYVRPEREAENIFGFEFPERVRARFDPLTYDRRMEDPGRRGCRGRIGRPQRARW